MRKRESAMEKYGSDVPVKAMKPWERAGVAVVVTVVLLACWALYGYSVK